MLFKVKFYPLFWNFEKGGVYFGVYLRLTWTPFLFCRDDHETPRINTKTLATLSSITFTLEKLFDQTHNYAEGYQVGLCRTTVMKPVVVQLPGGWMKKSNHSEKVWTYKLNLWCLNPAVVSSFWITKNKKLHEYTKI